MAERVISRRKEREINRIFNYFIQNNHKLSFQYFTNMLKINKNLKSEEFRDLLIKIYNYDPTLLIKLLKNHVCTCNNKKNCSICRSLVFLIKKKKRKLYLLHKFKLFTKVIGKISVMRRNSAEKVYSFGGQGYFIAKDHFLDSLKKQ